MSIELTPPITPLEDWLDIATDDFPDGAKARIADEVRYRVAETVERLQQEGLSPEEAFAQAYEELGDPITAFDEHNRILAETPGLTSLYSWLSAATRGLCEDAKARITAEIKAHVQEGLARFQQEDVPEDVAYFKAVAELGNPRKSRREFKRIHLTEREARYLDALRDSAKGSRLLKNARMWLYWVLYMISAWLLFDPHAAAWSWAFPTLIYVLIMIWNWRSSERKRSTARLHALITAYMTLSVFLYAVFFCVAPDILFPMLLVLSVPLTIAIAWAVRFYKKVRITDLMKDKSNVH